LQSCGPSLIERRVPDKNGPGPEKEKELVLFKMKRLVVNKKGMKISSFWAKVEI
jgi:hypothetical protein